MVLAVACQFLYSFHLLFLLVILSWVQVAEWPTRGRELLILFTIL